jgi:hypothetical protein
MIIVFKNVYLHGQLFDSACMDDGGCVRRKNNGQFPYQISSGSSN